MNELSNPSNKRTKRLVTESTKVKQVRKIIFACLIISITLAAGFIIRKDIAAKKQAEWISSQETSIDKAIYGQNYKSISTIEDSFKVPK